MNWYWVSQLLTIGSAIAIITGFYISVRDGGWAAVIKPIPPKPWPVLAWRLFVLAAGLLVLNVVTRLIFMPSQTNTFNVWLIGILVVVTLVAAGYCQNLAKRKTKG